MPGTILGVYGPQRSGKTLIAYKLTKALYQMSIANGTPIRVYTNLYCPQDEAFVFVNSIDELPLDLEPKIVLIDEIYNGCDAQDYRKLKDISIFINTLGKQNCLFLFTSIDAQMVYNRIRNQMHTVILVKGSESFIHYKIINMSSGQDVDFVVEKNAKLFEGVNYDTSFIPLDFNWEMTSWRTRLQAFYKEHYNLEVTV